MPSTAKPAPSGQTKDREWSGVPLDCDFFINSGLLFEINRQFLHPFGISMTVVVGADGKKTWGFKDLRKSPGELKFSREVAAAGVAKWQRFLQEWGRAQMDRRAEVMGMAVQYVERGK